MDLIIMEVYASEKLENIFYTNLGLIIKQNQQISQLVYICAIKKTQ